MVEDPKKIQRSSDHLKDALKVKISLDEDGKPLLVDPAKKKLAHLGVNLKGKCWRFKKS